jgi:hypothetical protein
MSPSPFGDVLAQFGWMLDPAALPDILRDFGLIVLTILQIVHILDHRAHRA